MPRPCSRASRTGSAVRAAYQRVWRLYLDRTAPVPSSCSSPPQVPPSLHALNRPPTLHAVKAGASEPARRDSLRGTCFTAPRSCFTVWSNWLYALLGKFEVLSQNYIFRSFCFFGGRSDLPEREMPPRRTRTAADGQPAQSELPVASWRQVIHFSHAGRLRLVRSSVCAAGLQAQKQCAAAG